MHGFARSRRRGPRFERYAIAECEQSDGLTLALRLLKAPQMAAQFAHQPDTLDAKPPLVPPSLDAGAVVADRFVVDARMQVGGMSAVYAARRIDGGLPVALKVAARGGTALGDHSLAIEARALARVRHP